MSEVNPGLSNIRNLKITRVVDVLVISWIYSAAALYEEPEVVLCVN